jgi:hypothetical protein
MRVLLRRLPVIALATSSALAAMSLAATEAHAENIIRRPGDHIRYSAELEPHLNFGLFDYRYADYRYGYFNTVDVGPGFRATIPIMDPGFVPRINDSVGITFGLDLGFCGDYCYRHVAVRSPVGIQWNFFVTPRFNVFADIGFVLGFDAAPDNRYGYRGNSIFYPDFFFMGGLRYLFTDKVGLTVRVGYPFVSVGVSFFVG